MPKINKYGDKKEILKKKEIAETAAFLKEMKGDQVETWCENTFSELPGKAQEGLKTLILAFWSMLQEDNR